MAAEKRKAEAVGDGLKHSKKAKPAPQKPATVLREEEPAFPRGGASILTPLEHRQIQIKAKQDVLFEQKTGRKSKATFDSEDEENLSDGGLNGDETEAVPHSKSTSRKRKVAGRPVEEKASRLRIEGLSYKRLVPGSLVLGQVSQINKYDITLALPNNLTGFIPITAMSDKITEQVAALAAQEGSEGGGDEDLEEIDLESLVSVGQYLRAYVRSTKEDSKLGARGKRHIELSIRPQEANTSLGKDELLANTMVQAEVASVEDHGVIMKLGIDDVDVRGFMSSKEIGLGRTASSLKAGMVFLCLITGLSANGKIVKLSSDLTKAGNIKKGNFLTDAPTVDAFLPGTAVEMLVSEVNSTGLAGKVMGMLDVTADLMHSGAVSVKSLEKKYPVGSKTKARIISTFPNSDTKKLGVSLLSHVINLDSSAIEPKDSLKISSIVEECKILKVEPGTGVFVDLNSKTARGFVHISRLSDDKVDNLSATAGPFIAGSVHRGRITGFNAMDGLHLVSFEKKILDTPYLRLEDVPVGEIVSGTVEKIVVNAAGVGGVLVKITDGITGLVPEMHLADVHLEHPEKKFKEGLKVKARVLSVNIDKRQMRLTLKKTLVNSEEAIWKSYDGLAEGMTAPGTIVNLLPAGAVIQFYGDVRAFLPVSQMSDTFIQDPKQHFRIGQVVTVHILSLDAMANRMVVTCRDLTAHGLVQQEALKQLQPGKAVKGSVTEKTDSEIVVELQDSGLKAILPIDHLVDGTAQKCQSAAKRIRVGQTLQDIIVLRKDENRRVVHLTSKPSLITASASDKLLKSLDEAVVGKEVIGFVTNTTEAGVFVQFAANITGLLPARQLLENVGQLPDYGLRKGQTISATVLSVDHARQRFLLTQKASTSKNPGILSKASRMLSNPVDGISTSIDDFTLGKLTRAKIVSVKNTQLNVQLADGLQGRVDVSEAFDSWEDIKDRKHPLVSFSARKEIAVRVLGIHDSRNHRFLPITHSNKAPVFELTAKPSLQNDDELDILTLNKVKKGSSWIVFVNNVATDCLWVNLSPNVRGRIRAMDVTDDLSLLSDIAKNFPVGSALKAKVSHVDVANGKLDLVSRTGASAIPQTLDDLSVGMVLPGRVTKVSERQLLVQLSEDLSAPVHLIDLSDDYTEANPTIYEKNQTVRVCVTAVDIPNKRFTLSMRPSKVLNSSAKVVDPAISSIHDLKAQQVVRGFIKNVADNGLFVSISSTLTAFIRVSDLSDSYIKDWKAGFEVDQLVKGKITVLDPALNHIQMSLKESVLDENYSPPLTYEGLQVGQTVTGKIRKVEDYGVFVVLDNSANVSGLCHRSEMAAKKVGDVKKLYSEGDAVKAKILKIDVDKRKMSLGLKAAYFEDEADESGENTDEDESDAPGALPEQDDDESESESESGKANHTSALELDDTDNTPNGVEDESEDSDASGGVPLKRKKAFQGLSVGGFDWSADLMDIDSKSVASQSDDDGAAPRKKKRRKAEITVDRTGELDANGPQSIADFERLLMGQPGSSYLWLQYMAFQLQLNEVDKARAIAERAIRMIGHQTDKTDSESMNVWIALLNLENTYGSDDSVEDVFKRACEYNDGEEMHTRLASIYIQSGKLEKADTLLSATVKKFSQNPKNWLNYATFLFTTLSAPVRARDLLPRAMQSLPTYHHFDLTTKFALLEFRPPNGDPERGRTLFEGLISTFPKRSDLWNVFIDAEIKLARDAALVLGSDLPTTNPKSKTKANATANQSSTTSENDNDQIRRLFNRITGNPRLKAKKAKFFFKKWLDWEERAGDARRGEMVKARAAEYVRREQARTDAPAEADARET